jgi:hypothetical protein
MLQPGNITYRNYQKVRTSTVKTALLINVLLVLCLCGAVVPGILPPARADETSGYWNFSPEISGNVSAVNAIGQAVIPANQSILPGDPLYALKLSFEQLDLSFTPNSTVRIEKSMHYTENRLREADIAQSENRTDVEKAALAQYTRDLNSTLQQVARARTNSSAHIPVHTLLARHLAVLNRTIARHPGSPDLLFAYNRTAVLLARGGRENSTPVHPEKTITARETAAENRSALS